MKWNHIRLSEDVQKQQNSQEITMIHRVLIMSIIHVLAHGDTDEIRPSDMGNKLLYMLATDYTQADWKELRQPSIQALIWYLDVFINTLLIYGYWWNHTCHPTEW